MVLNLPVEEILDDLKQHLLTRNELVLQAPPGAGKTTLIPLALKDEDWLLGKKILMLEPRRLATRAAAYRMANLLGESPGETVGYRMRLDTRVGPTTKIEVITEGILTRMLQQDPSLEEIGLVIFDEFHERNLDSDLALSLCLKGRSIFRDAKDPLKILVMSATLDSSKVAALLDDAPVISSEGKLYDVEIIYGRPNQPGDRIVDRTVSTLKKALADNSEGSILVFLPGQGEIRRTERELGDWLRDRQIKHVHLHALYGNLSIEDQQAAIAPLSREKTDAGHRKVVIATNIAETSLTIEGIDIVIDSGLAREPVFDAATGMTRLQTRKISRSSSIQRMGRAGRLRSGRCYRLWSQDQQKQLAPNITPEILKADLAPLALQLLQWGVDDPADMQWLDPPAPGAWLQALDLLRGLGAITRGEKNLTLTPHGKAMTTLPVHPRLAHLLISGVTLGYTTVATLLASILSDRDPFGQETPDITYRLSLLTGEIRCPSQHQGWLRRTRQLASQFEDQLAWLNVSNGEGGPSTTQALTQEMATGYLLACAYPDRIARRRHSGGYQLANGRSASLASNSQIFSSLGKQRWLAVAEVGGIPRSKGDSIRSAAGLDPKLFDSVLADLVTEQTVAEWDKRTRRFVAEHRRSIGSLVLKRDKLNKVPAAAKRQALIQILQTQGLGLLSWPPELRQWQARVLLMRSVTDDDAWPDVSDTTLLATLDNWITLYLDPVNLLSDFKKLDLKKILESRLTWDQGRQLNELVPTRLTVPSGSSISIDYAKSPPVLAVKLQEMFGCQETPTVAGGKTPLLIHLLSPAGRPLQVTQDLAGFWRSSYHDVKKEMKGRYPKHPWPDDPLIATPTRKTKGR